MECCLRFRRSAGMAPGVTPHDQGVLTIVGVVAAPDPSRLEAELLVQANCVLVRDPHLEGVATALVVACELEETLEQLGRDTASLMLRSFPAAKSWMQRQSKKRGTKKAHAILEAKIGRTVYHLWRKQTAFDAKKFLAS